MQTTHMPHEHAFLAMHREFADLQGLPSGSPIYVTLTAQPLTSLLSGASAAARLPGGRVINTAELGGLTGRQVASKATTNRTCGSCLACLLIHARPPCHLAPHGSAFQGRQGASASAPAGRPPGAPAPTGARPGRWAPRCRPGPPRGPARAAARAAPARRPPPASARARSPLPAGGAARVRARQAVQAAVELITARFEEPCAASRAVTLAHSGRRQPGWLCAATERTPQALPRGSAVPSRNTPLKSLPLKVRCSFLCRGQMHTVRAVSA